MAKRRNPYFVYYQPNEKDLKDEFGDCQVRALSKVLDCTWLEAFDMTIPICREEQTYTIFGGSMSVKKSSLARLGFEYTGVSNKKGTKRPTVKSFAKLHETGRYILKVANHVVACVNGKYYDTWDSGDCCLYGFYELKK